MIIYAAGPTYDAGNKVGLRRIKSQKAHAAGLNFEAIYIDYDNSAEIIANSGDQIIVQRLFDEVHEVELIGQVKSPGKYYYFRGMTLKDLLDLGIESGPLMGKLLDEIKDKQLSEEFSTREEALNWVKENTAL